MITTWQVMANPKEACDMITTLEAEIATLEPKIATLEAEIETYKSVRRGILKDYVRIYEVLSRLVDLCNVHGDFKNGVTDATGTIDEGNLIAGKIIVEAQEALKALPSTNKIHIVLDTRLPVVSGASYYPGRPRDAFFVKIEDDLGMSIDAGPLVKRPDGLYEIVVPNGITVTHNEVTNQG